MGALPLPIPNPEVDSPGPAGALDAGATYYTPQASDFSDLVAQALGDAGDPSDGWDADFNALATVLASLDDIDVTGSALDAALDAPLAEVMALGDDVAALIAAGVALSDASEVALQGSIAALAYLGPGPGQLSLPGIPGLPSLAAPELVDVTSMLTGIIEAVEAGFEYNIESELDQLWLLISEYGWQGNLPP